MSPEPPPKFNSRRDNPRALAPADNDAAAPSVWILLARDEALFATPAIREKADPLEGYSTRIRLWTDDYSNLFALLE